MHFAAGGRQLVKYRLLIRESLCRLPGEDTENLSGGGDPLRSFPITRPILDVIKLVYAVAGPITSRLLLHLTLSLLYLLMRFYSAVKVSAQIHSCEASRYNLNEFPKRQRSFPSRKFLSARVCLVASIRHELIGQHRSIEAFTHAIFPTY